MPRLRTLASMNVQRHVAVNKFGEGENLTQSKNSGETEFSLTDTSKSGMMG